MKCVALDNQKALRDLEQLPKLVEELNWLDVDKLSLAPEPAVICGRWLTDHRKPAHSMLKARTDGERVTVIVPCFKAGDLADCLGAPAAVHVKHVEFNSITWTTGEQFEVSGVVCLETALHAGQWATAVGIGPTVLCYQPHVAAGRIILCTAAVASRALGVRLVEQQRLLQRILEEAAVNEPASPRQDERQHREVAPDLGAFLDMAGEEGAALLLSLIAAGGSREADLAAAAQSTLKLSLTKNTCDEWLACLPPATLEEMAAALRAKGWGAFVRRLEQLMAARTKP